MHHDLVVVGGGHAGCEAAAASARLGRRTALVTLSRRHIGRLSCNPAVGGLAKGHLVRELDALGGLMARVADATCLHFRRLNTRKGLAVQASRMQVDIHAYPLEMQRRLAALEDLTVVEGEVAQLLVDGEGVAGVKLADGTTLWTRKVVLTTGTFLGGVLFQGETRTEGGRIGDRSTHALSRSLTEHGMVLGRLKTGTTPRLDARTIDWSRLDPQPSMPRGRFSYAPEAPPHLGEIQCYLVDTNQRTFDVVASQLSRSPVFSGAIEGSGPRYCPSLEDKVHRFPDRVKHRVFLEPESLQGHRVYPNGLSSSLPTEVQLAFLRTIEGLEQVEVLQYGYAVEYDFSDPRRLGPDLQLDGLPGLYLAGQINGTSGYEEAAVQGFVAGVSAATGEALQLGRHEAYIGVLIDDLTQRGVGGEPYRMFTSRAEHRLLLREDNADQRLMARGRALGLVDDATWGAFEARQQALERAHTELEQQVNPDRETLARLVASGIGPLKRPAQLSELLRRPDVGWQQLQDAGLVRALDPLVAQQVEVDLKYAGYVERAERKAARAARLEAVPLPEDVDWTQVQTLSWEVRERLMKHRPRTLGQVARLPGVTPAAIDTLVEQLTRSA